MSNPGISIIICCFNSAARLPDTLKHISLQEGFDVSFWEVIVVDNSSTDNTMEVAAQCWQGLNRPQIKFTITEERTPGKSYALKKGISTAAYDYVLICDDDNWLHPDYIAAAYAIINNDPTIGVLGGCGIFQPELPCRKEIESHQIAYVNGPQTWAESDHWVYGAGSICRRAALLQFFKTGWEQIAAGRRSSKMVCGEDVELCFMYYLNGYRIVSAPCLLFKHFVPVKRQNLEYILDLIYRQSYSFILLSGYRKLISRDETLLSTTLKNALMSSLKSILVTGIRNWNQRLFGRKALTFEQQAAMKAYRGTFFGILENKNKILRHFQALSTIHLTASAALQNGPAANQ
ncbi:glycosyltransferase family 2 protein [Mucilaginibacter sp. BJC16-A38]|uniref:glycosyltransferase family 2 protein n=1 Tax=Mucilaginibacter phenanthrenivorans TaxID=1234842 RepID=UPI002158940F|nr:glycosyltransferase family 2 protein [Mucilaginibacter phenanthrenivorans]MCR8560191.1 glycosyltransferase family 2 protein [Mucilaginibacter phenanthrenivorans]